MKHLFLALLLVIGFGTKAQVDGLFAFTLDSYQDTLFSMYNVAPDVRDELKSYLLETVHGYDVTDGIWIIDLPNSNSKVLGDLFLTVTEKYVLFIRINSITQIICKNIYLSVSAGCEIN